MSNKFQPNNMKIFKLMYHLDLKSLSDWNVINLLRALCCLTNTPYNTQLLNGVHCSQIKEIRVCVRLNNV